MNVSVEMDGQSWHTSLDTVIEALPEAEVAQMRRVLDAGLPYVTRLDTDGPLMTAYPAPRR